MLVFLFVALFGVALIITIIGLGLSPRSRTPRDVPYVLGTGRDISQGNRTRNVRRKPEVDQSYRRSKRSSASAKQARRSYSSSERMGGTRGVIGLWSTLFPHWLRIALLSSTVFSLCLLLFLQVMRINGITVAMLFDDSASQGINGANTTLYAENLDASNASKSIVRIAQLDQNQYSSQDEYNQWSPSACSVAAMTEVINAYGHNYRLTDILKVEAGLHEITPDLGLVEARGIDRTVAQFGFRMIPLQHSTLDDAIAVANQGHPVIVSFANSGYWPGGHILVLRGGDAQNVNLADSSRLNLTVVPRAQFLQWWRGFIAVPIPQ